MSVSTMPQEVDSETEPNDLWSKHWAMLKASGIASQVIQERGYRSVSDSWGLAELGLPSALTPGIAIPVHPPAGGDPIWVYRPDEPADPKRKYLWPARVQVRLDVPPRCRKDLQDISVPLYVVEGIKKADALASRGYCVIALMGVDCFGGKPEPGLPILSDWKKVELNGRLVRIAFDSDAQTNSSVGRARQKLTASLRNEGAVVEWVVLPDAADGSKQGIDDWFVGRQTEELEGLIIQPQEDPLVSATLNDIGNAERFAYENSSRARWSVEHQKWLCWDGRRWDPSNPEAVTRLAKETVRTTQLAAAKLPITNPARQPLVDHSGKMGNRYRVDAMTALARSELSVRADELDADPWLLNCLSGTVDLRTGELRPHSPGDLSTALCPVEYDPAAKAPEFERFISSVLDGDPVLVDFVQRAVGYSLTGQTGEQTYFVLTGDGGNGKGVLIRLLSQALGSYSLNLPAAALHKGRSSAQGFDIADLPGRRFATSSETTTTDHLDEQRVKALTGQEPFTAEHKYGRPFTFTPVAKLWLAVNGLPPTDDSSEGFWRRPAVILFPNQYSPEDDPTLWDRLTAELPGILAWAVEGCLAWQKRPLRPFPEQITKAVTQWRQEEDPLHGFLTECCEGLGDREATVPKAHLLAAYQAWSRTSGEEEIKTSGRGAQWSKALKRHGVTATVAHGASSWRGVRLNPVWQEWASRGAPGAGGGQTAFEAGLR